MRSLLLVGGGILIGVGLSYADATVRAEKKVREIEEKFWSDRIKTDLVRNTFYEPEAPAATEDELTFNPEGAVLTPESNPLPHGYVEEYVEKAAVYGDSAHILQSQPMEIIDDDQYSEDDGRAKEQIQVFMGDGEPYFVQDGMVIEDWQEKIGDNILVMFYQNFTPDHTGPRVIYVRNHERGEDFEILQEMGP